MSIALSNPFIFLLPAACLVGGYMLGRFGDSSKRERKAVEKAIAEKEKEFNEKQRVLSDSLSKELGSMREGLISTIRSYQQAVKVCSDSLPISSQRQDEIALLISEDVSKKDLPNEIDQQDSNSSNHEEVPKQSDVSRTNVNITGLNDSVSNLPRRSFEERYAELIQRKQEEALKNGAQSELSGEESLSVEAENGNNIKRPRGPGAPKQPAQSEFGSTQQEQTESPEKKVAGM